MRQDKQRSFAGSILRIAVVAIPCALWLMSCSNEPIVTDRRADVSTSTLRLDGGQFDANVWQGGAIYSKVYRKSVQGNGTLTWIDPTSNRLTDTDLESGWIDENGCTIAQYYYPSRWPNGEIGMVKLCARKTPNPAPTDPKWSDSYYLVAYDTVGGRLRAVWKDKLDTSAFGNGKIYFTSMNMSGTEGFAEIQGGSSGACDRVAGLDEHGLALPRLKIQLAGELWNLADDWKQSVDECMRGRIVFLPRFSPDGSRIVVSAGPDAKGIVGVRREDVDRRVYVADAQERVARQVVPELKSACCPAWSPNGEWLALEGIASGTKTRIYLYSIDRKELLLISDTAATSLSWSPDGTKIVGSGLPNLSYENDLIIFDVSKIVSQK